MEIGQGAHRPLRPAGAAQGQRPPEHVAERRIGQARLIGPAVIREGGHELAAPDDQRRALHDVAAPALLREAAEHALMVAIPSLSVDQSLGPQPEVIRHGLRGLHKRQAGPLAVSHGEAGQRPQRDQPLLAWGHLRLPRDVGIPGRHVAHAGIGDRARLAGADLQGERPLQPPRRADLKGAVLGDGGLRQGITALVGHDVEIVHRRPRHPAIEPASLGQGVAHPQVHHLLSLVDGHDDHMHRPLIGVQLRIDGEAQGVALGGGGDLSSGLAVSADPRGGDPQQRSVGGDLHHHLGGAADGGAAGGGQASQRRPRPL